MSTNEAFIAWLNEEMQKRDWNISETARAAGLAQSTVSMVVNGRTRPGFDFCLGIARAFNMRPEGIMHRAGLLPPEPGGSPSLRDLLHIASQLPDSDLDRLVAIARTLHEQAKVEKKAKK